MQHGIYVMATLRGEEPETRHMPLCEARDVEVPEAVVRFLASRAKDDCCPGCRDFLDRNLAVYDAAAAKRKALAELDEAAVQLAQRKLDERSAFNSELARAAATPGGPGWPE